MRRLLLSLAAMALAIAINAQSLILGGELSNSAATCIEDIDNVMPRMKALGLNTVLVPAQWDLIEPEEGKFYFTLIDRTIDKARENNLKVIFLWFGAWKNSMSCYAPLWFKQNTKKYPRAITSTGKPLEIASAFSENVFQADCRAFTKLIRKIAEKDADERTVIMVQVENEIGMLEDARDHSQIANKLYNSAVPSDLLTFLKSNKKTLHKTLAQKINFAQQKNNFAQQKNKSPQWKDLFGDDIYTEEIFTAYYYAKYVERLAKAAHEIYDIPFYVNAAMNSRGRKPGEYPSAGPLAHLIDIWHCAAPSIEMLAPDIYDTGFKSWCAQYALPNNKLFIPESRCCRNSGVRALYAFGEHAALGFSPFAIDQASPYETENVTKAYGLIKQLEPLLTKKMWGLLFDQEDKERIITDGDISLTCRHYFTLPWDSRATDGSTWDEGGAIVIKLADKDYLIAGSGVVVSFQTNTEREQTEQKQLGEDGFAQAGGNNSTFNIQQSTFKGKRLGIGYVDQVEIANDGTIKYLRRENGDQSHQGRHARISVGDYKILRVKLYEY